MTETQDSPTFYPRRIAFGLMMMSRFLENASTPSVHFPFAGQADRKASLFVLGLAMLLSISSGCSALVGKTKGPSIFVKTISGAKYEFSAAGFVIIQNNQVINSGPSIPPSLPITPMPLNNIPINRVIQLDKPQASEHPHYPF